LNDKFRAICQIDDQGIVVCGCLSGEDLLGLKVLISIMMFDVRLFI
jgi:hypothetical protein